MSDTGRIIHRDCTMVHPCRTCLARAQWAEWPDYEGLPISWCERDRISADGP